MTKGSVSSVVPMVIAAVRVVANAQSLSMKSKIARPLFIPLLPVVMALNAAKGVTLAVVDRGTAIASVEAAALLDVVAA